MKDAKDDAKPEPQELEHGTRVIADRIFTHIPMLFISKPDRIVARDTQRSVAAQNFPMCLSSALFSRVEVPLALK